VVAAPGLLGLVLEHEERAGRIVEVEAYRGATDPASHAYRGRTARNSTMFGRAGLLYVYFTYGMHWCANVVCGPEGEAGAVLLRALEPMRGLDRMRAARLEGRRLGGRRLGGRSLELADCELCRGPANLARALGIGGSHDGSDLLAAEAGPSGPRLVDDGGLPPDVPGSGPRIGVRLGSEQLWRFWVPGDPHVSGRRVIER